jgi:transposase, IS5 family
VIAVSRLQRTFADGLIFEEVEDLWERWMRHADKALEDKALLLLIQQELMKRCKKSKTRGRPATPAEVVLRMMLLKHVRDWSYEALTREVRANLVYREFTRIGGDKVLFRLSWKWRKCSAVKITERTREEDTETLHRRRESGDPEAALA